MSHYPREYSFRRLTAVVAISFGLVFQAAAMEGGRSAGPTLDEFAQRYQALRQELGAMKTTVKQLNDIANKARRHISRATERRDKAGAYHREYEQRYVHSARLNRAESQKSVEALDKHSRMLTTAHAMLENASKEIERVRSVTCDHAKMADAEPRPGSSRIQAWIDEASDEIVQAGEAMRIAASEVEAQTDQVIKYSMALRRTPGNIEDEKNLLLGAIQLFQDNQRMYQDALTELSQAGPLIEKAKETAREFVRRQFECIGEAKELTVGITALQRSAGYSDSTGQADHLLADISDLEEQCHKVSDLYNPASDSHISERELQALISTGRNTLASLARNVSALDGLGSAVQQVLAEAEAAQVVDLGTAPRSPEILEAAETCLTSLKSSAQRIADGDGNETHDTAVRLARQALQECNYPQAESRINALPPGTERDELIKKLVDEQALENTLKSLVEEARRQYRECKYDLTLSVLREAEQKARCQKHLDSIADKMNKANAGQQLEAELRSMVDKANTFYQQCRFKKAMPVLNEALSKARCPKDKESINKKIDLTRKRQRHEQATLDLFEAANELYTEGKYPDALARLQKALKHTSCTRFKDSLGKKIAKVRSKIDIGQERQDEEQQRIQPPDSCTALAQQLGAHVEMIRSRVEHYNNLVGSSPQPPRSQTGPSACKVVDAEKLYQDTWLQAKNAGCTEAVRIKHPFGISTNPIGLDCWRYRGRVQDPVRDETNRSCSIQVHDDLGAGQTGTAALWTMGSEIDGKRKTVHIARSGGPWWKGYRARARLGFMGGLLPQCSGGPCSLADMKEMANDTCERWKRQP